MPSTSIAGRALPGSSVSRIGSSADVTSGRLMPASGASAATITASSAGETSGPPAEYAYAVEPIEVEMTRPSQR